MYQTQVSSHSIKHTLRHLQEAGRRGTECVVLWFGRREDAVIRVQQVYRPIQMARANMFRIPPDSMEAVLSEISSKRLMIAAQVHSHPLKAFQLQGGRCLGYRMPCRRLVPRSSRFRPQDIIGKLHGRRQIIPANARE